MKRRRSAYRIFLVFWILLSLGSDVETRESIAASVLSALEQDDVNLAASFFHIPGSPDAAERAKESQEVADLMRIVSRHFGQIQSATPTHAVPEVHELGVMGGDATLWEMMDREGIDAQSDYKVRFSLVGEGYLRFAFVRTDNGLRVRHVLFALSVVPSENRRIMESIGMDVLLEMNLPSLSDTPSARGSIKVE